MNKSEDVSLQASEAELDRLRRCQNEFRGVLTDVLAISPTATDVDLKVFDQVAPERGIDQRAFAWELAALSLEDKAIKLAEGWLEDPELDPERLGRIVDLLSDVPGYWALRGLDGDLLEQVARQLHVPTPRPISAKLRFVLGVLALVEHDEDLDQVLVE